MKRLFPATAPATTRTSGAFQRRSRSGTIGITLNINDLTDSSILWDRLDAHNQEIWTAAWRYH